MTAASAGLFTCITALACAQTFLLRQPVNNGPPRASQSAPLLNRWLPLSTDEILPGRSAAQEASSRAEKLPTAMPFAGNDVLLQHGTPNIEDTARLRAPPACYATVRSRLSLLPAQIASRFPYTYLMHAAAGTNTFILAGHFEGLTQQRGVPHGFSV